MWISKNQWDTYGYQKPNAFMKGDYRDLNPALCYQIFDVGPPNSEGQYHVIPISSPGQKIGPAVIKTSGVSMASIWNDGKTSTKFNISDTYPL